jgi:hypothetical protein
MYSYLDLSTANSGLGTPLRSGGQIINDNFHKLHAWMISRANIAANSIPTLAEGGPPYVLATEFSPGNPMGLSAYKRRSTAPADTTNPGYVMSLDNQWWELLPNMGAVIIEQFGGKGDSGTDGIGGTDNYQPLKWALDFIKWQFGLAGASRYAPAILFDSGNYRFTAPAAHPTWCYDIHQPVRISGVFGTGQYQGGSVWHFPNTCDPIIFGGDNTDGPVTYGTPGHGSSIGAVLENLSIWGGGGLGIFTDINRTMIRCRATVTLRNLSLYGIPGRGIYQRGGGGDGNVNNFHVENVYILEAGFHYFHVEGSDTNGSSIKALVTHGEGGRGGCGVLEVGSLGCNTYEACQLTGYGNLGVKFGGRLYQLIVDTGGSTTTPGTNDQVWMDIGVETGLENPVQFPTWSGSNTYFPQSPFLSLGGSNALIGNYCEVSAIQAHHPGSLAIAGNLPSSRFSGGLHGGAYGSPTISAQALSVERPHPTGSAEATAHGAMSVVRYGDAFMGTNYTSTGGIQVFRLQDKDTSWWEFGWRGEDLVLGRPGQYDHIRITGKRTANTFRRTQPVEDVVVLGTIALVDNLTGDSMLIGLKTSAPSITAGEYGRGEHYYYKDPSPSGYLGQVCTTGGVVAQDWVTAAWSTGTYKRMSNGNFYRVVTQGGGASTVQPTHTSGNATLADGFTWKFITGTPAVFKQFAPIEA